MLLGNMWNIYHIQIGILLKKLLNFVKVFNMNRLSIFLILFNIDGKCSLAQIYVKHNRVFVKGVPVQVVKIEAERSYNPVTEFLNPYLYVFR